MTKVGTVRRLAMEVGLGLKAALPKLRKTVVSKVALAVGAMIEGQTPNTTELANLLPLDTDRQDMREQWLRRLLKNPLLSSVEVLEPWARQALAAAGQNGQTIILSMDQTDVGDRFALLMVSLGVGDRALPLAWTVEAGPANLGFNAQNVLLERVRAWLPAGAEVLLSADRFYPSVALFEWLHAQPDWHYRLRVKGNLNVDPGVGDIVTTGELAAGQTERDLPVMFVPAFTGLGAPYWDADARGAIFGLTRDTGIKELVTAALLSVCYQTRDLQKAMEADGVRPDTLRVDGGMARNDFVLQNLADLLGCRVDRPRVTETTALGVAWLAGLHCGLYDSLDSISGYWQLDTSFQPEKPKAWRDARYRAWQDAVNRTRSTPTQA